MIYEGSRSAAAVRAAAHEEFRRSVAAGAPLSAAELGAAVGRSARWARREIADVNAQLETAAGDLPIAPGPKMIAAAPAAEPATATVADPSVVTDGQHRPVSTGEAAGQGVANLANLSVRRVRRPAGYWWALCSFLGAVTLSVAANVGHTLHPRAAAGQAGQALASSDPGAVVAAASWPLLLLGAVEVLTRVRWPRGLWWGVTRYGAAVTVAMIAAIMSYRHMVALLTVYGEDGFSAHLGPIAVDGLILVSGIALLAIGVRRRGEAE